MLSRLRFLKRAVGWLGLVLFLTGPLESLMPDDCDGHVPTADLSAHHPVAPDHGSPAGHPSSAPHTCHDLHNHGGFAVVVMPAVVLPATLATLEEAAPRVHLATAAHETFRPPIV